MASLTAAERRELAAKGAALPDGRFPTPDLTALTIAVKAYDPTRPDPTVARYLARRGRALGAPDALMEKIGDLAEVTKAANPLAPAAEPGRQVELQTFRKTLHPLSDADLIELHKAMDGDVPEDVIAEIDAEFVDRLAEFDASIVAESPPFSTA